MGLEVGGGLVLIAADDDGQKLGVGASDDASCVVLWADGNVVVGEGVALVVDLVLVDDLGIPVEVVLVYNGMSDN